MKHTYSVSGMSCTGCQTSVEGALNNLEEITKATVDLKKSEVEIEMTTHIPLEKLQETLLKAGLHYTIEMPGSESGEHGNHHAHQENQKHQVSPLGGDKRGAKGNGVFYCPMHCEGEKTYDKMGDCPVCGMDLIEQPSLQTKVEYTCPMHPEVEKDGPGACPICGMDLVPKEPSESAEEKTYTELVRKMKISVAFALPVFMDVL